MNHLVILVFIIPTFLSTCLNVHGAEGNHGNEGGPAAAGGSSQDNNGKLLVIISFDSMNQDSIEYFKFEIAPIFKDFSKCVQWHWIPCSTSQIVKDVFKCRHGVMECQIDVLHACAAHFYEDDEYKLGKFFICMMQDDNQYNKGEGCANEAGMDWKKLSGCQPSKEAATFCDNRYNQISALHIPKVPGIIYNWKYNKEADEQSFMSLKTGICAELKKINSQCAACGNSASGSGGQHNGGGGNGGQPGGGQPGGGSPCPSSGGPSGGGPSGK